MSTDTTTAVPFDFAAAIARHEEQAQRRAALAPAVAEFNKNALLDALRPLGITGVEVTFDGYGDSGQLDEPSFANATGAVDPPVSEIEIQSVLYDGSGIDTARVSITEAIEQICYDLLGEHHAGWENNDGAYGDFVFDVTADAIAYTHNSRYTEVDTSSYEL
jgi:hypothetical protein